MIKKNPLNTSHISRVVAQYEYFSLFKATILNLWVMTSLGGQMTFSQGPLKTIIYKDIYIIIQNSSKLLGYKVANKIILWLGVTRT